MRRQISSASIDFAVPGGPMINTCWEASRAERGPSISSPRSDLKVICPLDAAADLVGEHRFCGSRRTDDQHVLGGEQGGKGAIDQLATFRSESNLPPGCGGRSRRRASILRFPEDR